MSDFIGDRECVTHHYACECIEAAHKALVEKLGVDVVMLTIDRDRWRAEAMAARDLIHSNGDRPEDWEWPGGPDLSAIANRRTKYRIARAANEEE